MNALGLGFYQKLGLKDHQHFQTAFKNNKEVLYHTKIHAKQPTKDLIMPIVLEFLEGLNFGKSMRWGNVEKALSDPFIIFACCLMGKILTILKSKSMVLKPSKPPKRTDKRVLILSKWIALKRILKF